MTSYAPTPASVFSQKDSEADAAQIKNANSLYDLLAQRGVGRAWANPQTAAALLALSQQNAPATAPFPGQPSASQGQQPGGGQPMPPIMPVTQDQTIPASQLQQPTGGGPGLSVMPGGPIPPPPSPSQIPNNPFGNGQPQQMPQGIPGAQPMQQQTQQPNIQQLMQQLMQQYPPPGALISAVQQANPSISGASLSKLIQQIVPMYQNRAGSQDPYKALIEQQKLGIGAGAPDPEVVSSLADQIKSTGSYQALNRMPGPIRESVMKQLQGFDPAKAQIKLAGNKAQSNAAGGISGRTNSAREDMAMVLSGPAARSALEYLPDDANALSGYARNTFKNFKNSPDYKAFKAANTAAAGEITRALTGGRPNLTIEREVESQLNNATDKSAWAAVANSYLESGAAAAKASQKVTSQGGISDTDTESIKLPGNAPSDDGWGEMKVQ